MCERQLFARYLGKMLFPTHYLGDFLSIVKITGEKTLLNLSPHWQTQKGQQTICKELPPLPNMKTLQKMQPRCIPYFFCY